ncbi:MAG: Asp-tRNA(Asn)/Glu-tRNA(Gln) amidotransferase subunit GatC [Mycobacteriales bacterium]
MSANTRESATARGAITRDSVITREEVAHLAQLARLAVTDSELDHFAAQLDVILSSVAQIAKVATNDVEPTTHAVPLTNVLRADEPGRCLDRDTVLLAAPATEQGRFRVPRILDIEE